MKFGDYCRTTHGAPARYMGEGLCVWISSQGNDVLVGRVRIEDARAKTSLPYLDDDELKCFAAGYSAGARAERVARQ